MRRNYPIYSFALLITLTSALCSAATRIYTYKVIAKYPHSTQSYTEGFFFKDGLFYEGTGLEGHSQILITDPVTGKVVQHVDIPPQYFGEGIVDWGPNLIEWTWQTHIGFIYDRFSFRVISRFHYDGEGWGITRTDKQLITSNGTATLTFRDPTGFKEIRHIVVKDRAKPILRLNELEYIKGEIYANIWHSDRIARISPRDGHVIAWIDCTGLLPENQKINAESVLNGIAYDAAKDRLFVTGKQWPLIFEIKEIKEIRKSK